MNDLRTAAQQALEALEQFGLDNPHRSYELEHAVIAALKAALAQQADPVEPVAWVASKDGRVIYDDASTDDGLLRVSGDFENDEQRISYAKQIVDKLNAASAQQKDPIDPGHDVDVLREHVRHLERRVRQLHAQQAEPVDPVAWTLTKTLTERKTTTNGFLWFSDPVNSSWTALYTAPPQRTMVPLTEEEIFKIENDIPDDVISDRAWTICLTRAVEKASWEKNHGQA